eukprot:6274592-Heterocapsa_arctica.AAC.1
MIAFPLLSSLNWSARWRRSLYGELCAALFEKFGADLLTVEAEDALFLVGVDPRVHRPPEILELEGQYSLFALEVLEADSRLRAKRHLRAGLDGDLALLHLQDGELDGVAHVAAACGELERGRGEAGELLLAVSCGRHLHLHVG